MSANMFFTVACNKICKICKIGKLCKMSTNTFFTVACNTILKSEDSNFHLSIDHNQCVHKNTLNNPNPPGTPSHHRRLEPKVLKRFVIHNIQHIIHFPQYIIHIIQHIIYIIQHIIHIAFQHSMTNHLWVVTRPRPSLQTQSQLNQTLPSSGNKKHFMKRLLSSLRFLLHWCETPVFDPRICCHWKYLAKMPVRVLLVVKGMCLVLWPKFIESKSRYLVSWSPLLHNSWSYS